MKQTISFHIDTVINEYTPYVYKIIKNIVGTSLSCEDQEEILSDTFYLLWKNQDKINSNLKSYLATIARNCAYEKLRNHKITLAYDEKIVSSEIENRDRIIFIKQKLEKLTEEEKKIFELYYVYGYKVGEISAMLKMHNSTVKVKLYRLRKKLKEEK